MLARDCSWLKNKNCDKPETILQLTSGIKLAQFLLPICIDHTQGGGRVMDQAMGDLNITTKSVGKERERESWQSLGR